MQVQRDIPVASEVLSQVKPRERNGPCAIVIFGGAGDLAARKLLTALFGLCCTEPVLQGCVIVGAGMPPMNNENYRNFVTESIRKHGQVTTQHESKLRRLIERTFYVSGDIHDRELYRKLDDVLKQLVAEKLTLDNRLYYLAVPPSAFSKIARHLQAQGMAQVHGPHHWRRVIIEKPFGRDLQSAGQLNRDLEEVFEEWQVYRIDHYLAKEPVQNIMALRFANGIFEPLWNHHHVDHVQITAAETLGVGKRGAYFEEAGALRDMVQNHLLQLVALVAMEPPPAFDANAVRDEQAKVLRSIRPMRVDQVDDYVVRGQYGAGIVSKEQVLAYREELGVHPASNVETYVAAKLFIDNWRWAGVPFYVRTGKRLPQQLTEISIFFRKSPHLIFNRRDTNCVAQNALVLRIQKEESITLHFEAKTPGHEMSLHPVNMHFHYDEAFGRSIADPYSRLILDCMKGDATLFMRKDNVEIGWWLIEPILERWGNTSASGLPSYPAGSGGPEDASRLLWKDGRKWKGL